MPAGMATLGDILSIQDAVRVPLFTKKQLPLECEFLFDGISAHNRVKVSLDMLLMRSMFISQQPPLRHALISWQLVGHRANIRRLHRR
ncbi:MAG: hypothetical protein QGF59_05455, partial [Pirellulaceae bacterium]|nr:hypothetical protein [Pirellulaceae bacterium]